MFFNLPFKPVSFWRGTKCADTLALPWGMPFKARSSLATIPFGPWTGYYTADFKDVMAIWPTVTDTIFLSQAYLGAQAEGNPSCLNPRFLVLEDESGPFAWIALQLASFRALEDIRDAAVWEGWRGRIRRFVARWGNFNLLICGNLFSVGAHGWMLRPDWGGKADFVRQLGRGLRRIALREGASVVVFKDFEHPLEGRGASLHPLHFQPNMVMDLRPAWSTMKDYLDAMSSKYRVRVNRAYRKSESLEFRILDFYAISSHADALAQLYQGIVFASGFSLACAGPTYFPALKRALGDSFRLTGVFEQEQLVGFYSTIHNGMELEAHFIGFLPEMNQTHQIYLNMLYRMVEEAIQHRVRRIHFARTALEIKSSVGAVAKPATVYMAHTNRILNIFLPQAVRFLEPKESWLPRHPFRQD